VCKRVADVCIRASVDEFLPDLQHGSHVSGCSAPVGVTRKMGHSLRFRGTGTTTPSFPKTRGSDEGACSVIRSEGRQDLLS
jgi:hypothetical protein